MWNRNPTNLALRFSALLLAATVTMSCAEEDALSLTVEVNNRALSKVPYFIAWDQGLYEKHGLEVELVVSPPTDEAGNVIQPTDFWTATKMRLGMTTFTEGGKIVEPTDIVMRAFLQISP